jgi:hypothetical protein
MKNWFEQLGATSIVSMLQQLGYERKGKRWGPAPCCSEVRASKSDHRPPVNTLGDKMWICNACQTKGNIFDLISQHIHKRQMEDTEWTVIRDWWASFDDNTQLLQVVPDPTPTREYPPLHEVEALLSCSMRLNEVDKSHFNRYRDYNTWMKFRQHRQIHDNCPAAFLRPDADIRHLTQVESSRGTLSPWWRPEWRRQYPLVLPLWDKDAHHPISLLGRTWGSAARKTTVPIGYTTANLFLVNKLARAWLQNQTTPSIIWIVEGEIDFINVSQADKAVIGIRSGSINGLALMPWHRSQKVLIATDNDQAGDKYAHDAAIYCRPAQPMRIKFNEQA